MYKVLILLFTFFFTVNLQAQSIVNVVEGLAHPESAVAANGNLYISNIGDTLAPTAKDGDGFITKINTSNNRIEKFKFLPEHTQLHAPKGLAIANNILYVADIDRVVGFDLNSRKQVFERPLPDAQYLNDIVIQSNETLFVSATNTGRIFRIDLNDNSYRYLDIPEIKGANGLVTGENENTLYCVGFGENNKPTGQIIKIDLSTQQTHTVTEYRGYLDGVQYQNGSLYFTDWKAFEKKGIINRLGLNSGKITAFSLEEPIAGPADFILDIKRDQFYVPALLENKLYIIE